MFEEQHAAASATANPRISVLMPVYNGGEYLAPAIDSILAQSFADFEFLILDDGSTDSTPATLAYYAGRDRRIKVISRPNRGLVVSLNELLRHARAELVARMDADDIALPERFAQQVEFLARHPEVVCVGGACMMIDGAGRYLTTIVHPLEDESIQAAGLAGHTPISHPAAMMRRDALEVVGRYNVAYSVAEDLDLWLRLGELGKLANLAVPVIKYRLHEKSLSEQAAEGQRGAQRRACEAAWRRRGIAGSFEGAAWRPGADAGSRHTFMLRYGWWAWNSGERRTALHYGWRAVCEKALHPGGWKLLLVALAKRLPGPTGAA